MFVAYNASLYGLQYYQLIISINSIYLKEKYYRVFPAATTIDVQEQLFLIAFSIFNANKWWQLVVVLAKVKDNNSCIKQLFCMYSSFIWF